MWELENYAIAYKCWLERQKDFQRHLLPSKNLAIIATKEYHTNHILYAGLNGIQWYLGIINVGSTFNNNQPVSIKQHSDVPSLYDKCLHNTASILFSNMMNQKIFMETNS